MDSVFSGAHPYISAFDMLKVGVGPSSSHTMGPWLAMRRFVSELRGRGSLEKVCRVRVQIFGSLAKTGLGHGTDIAILLGLEDYDYRSIDCGKIGEYSRAIVSKKVLRLGGQKEITFEVGKDLQFRFEEVLPFHPNGIRCEVYYSESSGPADFREEYYSIGGGFVLNGLEAQREQGTDASPAAVSVAVPYSFDRAEQLIGHCVSNGCTIAELVRQNEDAILAGTLVDQREEKDQMALIWQVMLEAVYRGIYSEGELPSTGVPRRAPVLFRKFCDRIRSGFFQDLSKASRADDQLLSWLMVLRQEQQRVSQLDVGLELISTFAIAVNEHNACFGRVVTAPTNGSAGVIPAVLLYYAITQRELSLSHIHDFLYTASAIGSLFKSHATISAAMGGCQAEIGVSSAMAAAAYCATLGGSVEQVCAAAEIAMEHHLGLTCDPVGGLVQIPCIERNAIGAVKAITAALLARKSEPQNLRVSLDDVIQTMWETAQGMSFRYKETSEGGLALRIPIQRSSGQSGIGVGQQDTAGEAGKEENSMAYTTC